MSQQFLAEALVLVRPDTTKFRVQLEAQLLAATRGLTVPVGVAGGANLKANSQNLALLGANAQKAAAGTQKLTAAERDHIRTQGQLISGSRSAILAQLGLRGATLAAGGAFLAGAVSIKLASETIRAASDRTEQLNKSVEVFQGSAAGIQKWAETTATSLGISETAALAAASSFGGLFRTLNVGPQQAAELSKSLVSLASDLASFNNVGTDRALQAIQSGLVGQARPLRQLQVFLTEARVKQEAFAETGKRSATALTQQDKILARYSLILQDASIQVGDFGRTQNRLANQSRILSANLSDLAANIGSKLTPVITGVVVLTNKSIKAFEDLDKKIGSVRDHLKLDFGAPGLGPDFSFLTKIEFPGSGALGRVLRISVIDLAKTKKGADDAGNALVGFGRDAGDASKFTERLFASTEAAARSMDNLGAASTRAGDKLQALQAAGAGPGAQLPAARQILASDLAILDRLVNSDEAKGRATKIRQIRDKIISDRTEIKSLEGEISSSQQQAASDANAAAQKAKDARDREDQSLLDLFGTQQTRITDRLIGAGPREEIRLTIALRNLFRKQRDEARKQIHDLQLRKQTLAADTTQIITLNKQIADLRKQQADALAQQAQQRREDRLTHLEALLSIAETTPGEADDRRRIKAIEEFDRKRIDFLKRKKRLTREEKQELDALRVDLAQREQSLRQLNDQQKKNNTASAEFAFLQTQTGFVSNLLGNLIPTGATGGLVGGGTPSVPANVRPSLSQAQTQAQAGIARGVTSGQGQTQIEYLRQIRDLLKRLNQGDQHPEGKKQRRTGAAIMDFQSASPGF